MDFPFFSSDIIRNFATTKKVTYRLRRRLRSSLTSKADGVCQGKKDRKVMKKITFLALSVLVLISSCSSYTATGAGFGGVIGSAIGGIAGGYHGRDVGTLVGMAAGAATGAAIENAKEQQYRNRVATAVENDGVYYDSNNNGYGSSSRRYGTPNNDAKSRRIKRYHDNVERRGTHKSTYSTKEHYNGQSNGFHLEPTDDRRLTEQKVTTTESVNDSGYSSTAKYDDRIELE